MADAAETVKKTVETATAQVKAQTETVKAQAEKFQAAGAKTVRDTMDKSMASMTELSAEGQRNLEAVAASAAAAQKGAEVLSAQTVAFAKKSWEDGVAASQTLAQARSVQELIELQTTFAKSAMETWLSETTKMTETLTASVKDSFKPLNERVTASVERLQAAR